jgi:hypothetical protein
MADWSPAALAERKRFMRKAAFVLIPFYWIMMGGVVLASASKHGAEAATLFGVLLLVTLAWNLWVQLLYQPRLRREFPA